MNQTNTSEMITKGEILAMFDRLPRGASLLGVDELMCGKCGEMYYQRSFVDVDRFVHTDKKACACERTWLENRDYEREQMEAREKLQGECDYYFAKHDMLQDQYYDKCVLSKFDIKEHPSRLEAYRALTDFVIGQDSICFYGPTGRGKSFLAVGFAREQKRKGFTALSVKCPVLLDRIKLSYSLQDKEAESNIVRILQSIDLLVMDEVGIENATPWAIEMLYKIIDYRHDHKKSSIYTTNQTGREMEDKEGVALRSRILGVGGPGSKYLIDGRDRRVT